MRAVLYARVSTKGPLSGGREQNIETQLLALRQYVTVRGWAVVAELSDVGVSGRKESRPGLDELMRLARGRQLDAVVVVGFDRFGRSLSHLVRTLEEFTALGVAFVSIREQMDLTTPAGRLMFALVAAMAEFERSLIQERVRAGMRRVAVQGTRSGRPVGRPGATFDRGRAAVLRAEGHSFRRIAREVGGSEASVRRALRQTVAPPPAGAP